VERELAPEWSVRITYTQRLAWRLLQDVDVNHVLCVDYGPEFGIPPEAVCGYTVDAKGRVLLSDDLFGTVSQFGPNGAPDLYNVSPYFNQVLRVGNFNSSHYRSIALEVVRRLHRNWQMNVSYTYSKAYGQAESFLSGLGDDPTTVDDEEGYLSYDQRHRGILLFVTRLPLDIELGTTVTWESGTPYSVVRRIVDQDNAGNAIGRTFYPSRRRNDQRNDGYWDFDLKVQRGFTFAHTRASAELAVKNILNNDAATLGGVVPASGVTIRSGPQGLRRFGRYWEIGMSLSF